jgi:hypothetical protein
MISNNLNEGDAKNSSLSDHASNEAEHATAPATRTTLRPLGLFAGHRRTTSSEPSMVSTPISPCEGVVDRVAKFVAQGHNLR